MFVQYLWRRKLGAIAYMTLATLSAILLALFTLRIADVFSLAQIGDYSSMLELFGFMFCWYIAIRVLDFLTEVAGIRVINQIREDIKADLFGAIFHKELPEFYERNSGEYIAEFTNDITMLEAKFLIPSRDLFGYLVTIVSSGTAIVTIDVRMTVLLAAGVLLCLLIPFLATKYTSARMLQFIEQFDEFIQHLKDCFNAFFTIKNYAIEEPIVRRFSSENHAVERNKYSAELSLVTMNSIIGRMAWLIELLVIMIGLVGVMQGTLVIGSVFSAYILAGQLGRPMQSLADQISMIRSVKGIEKKFKRLRDIQAENMLPDAFAIPSLFDIDLSHVGLTLHGKEILKDINCTFEQGKKYLVLGSNGSGKSTLAKLLQSTYRNYTGRITLAGYELQTKEGICLSRRISYSNETVCLISDTVRNNILLYREIPEELIVKAVRQANLTVPMDQIVGDGGRNLSSGERRKLELARVLIEQPKVLILDEIVSTLDIETAYEIEKLILNLTGCTIIMISNAFSGQLLDQYDEITLMEQGHIMAHGTHKTLIKNSSTYREIYDFRCGSTQEGDRPC